MLKVANTSDNTRALVLCDFNSNPNLAGCHVITPFKCEQDAVDPKIWRIHAYDNNYPAVVRIVEIDTVANMWTYAPFNWNDTAQLFLEPPIENFYGPATLPGATTTQRAVADQHAAVAFSPAVAVYMSAADTALLESPPGVIGDSLVNTVYTGHPIVPISSHSWPPLGYVIPKDDWSCRVASMTDSIFRLSIVSDTYVMTYARTADTSADSGRFNFLAYDEALWTFNTSGSPQPHALETIAKRPGLETVISIKGIATAPGDSIEHQITWEPGLQIANHSDTAGYEVEVRLVGTSVNLTFRDSTLTLPAHTGHRIVPSAADLLGDSLKILIDDGNDGTIDDSMFATDNIATDVADDSHGSVLPLRYELAQNYPNPFNSVTTIAFAVPRPTHVVVAVYNVLGQRVRTLVNEARAAGSHTISWDGHDRNGSAVASGVYFYRLRAGDHVATKKMLLLR